MESGEIKIGEVVDIPATDGTFICVSCGKFFRKDESEYTGSANIAFDNTLSELFIFKCIGCGSYRALIRVIHKMESMPEDVSALAREG